MPPAAVGAAFVAAGVTATAATVTAVVTAVYIGAAIGAVVGAATALVTGGDVLKGAISGAVIGGITSGIGSAFGGGAAAATTVGEVGVETVGVESVLAAEDAAAGAALTSSASDAGVAGGVTQTVTPTPKPDPPDGILSGVGNWANNNPTQASVIVDALGGVASSMYESSTKQEELEAEMERDQLNIDALKIKGLTNTDLKTSLPSIATFTEEPAWTIPSTGIIWGGMSNA
uniref:Uncharacterized protein n=1 Tax=viral metagenome TaxID=1070528 RepID=A0A6M3XKX0_9ZZZZ